MSTCAELLKAQDACLYANQLCSEGAWGWKRPIIILSSSFLNNYNDRVKCDISGIVLLCTLILQKK